MGENDRVRWVGVRKIYPAIADLQAFESCIGERIIDTDTAAGTQTMNSASVPAGKLWVVTGVHAVNYVSANTYIHIYARNPIARFDFASLPSRCQREGKTQLRGDCMA